MIEISREVFNYFFATVILAFYTLLGYSQNIFKVYSSITLDGKLTESIWKKEPVAQGFYQNFPDDQSKANTQTEVHLAYDDENIYVAAKCYFLEDNLTNIQNLRRDFDFSNNDAFSIVFEPFNDKFNGFYFSVTPSGSKAEGLIENGSSLALFWDNRWYSEVHIDKNHWTVEMAIPLKTLRFKNGVDEWGFNFARRDLSINEISTWQQIPINFDSWTLAYTQKLKFEEPPLKPKTNISIIPGVTSIFNNDYENKTSSTRLIPSLDGKVAISSSLNLDVTINPDFSQAEVDRQVLNLTRFNVFFPERRNFFLENSDLFASFGFRQIRPFFSRRIGLENGRTVPILYGARLSGKINKDWRIGVMNMQTEGLADLNLASYNYSVAAVQRQIFSRSNIAAIFVNKQGIQNNSVDFADFNRVVGVDYNIASADNKIRGKLFYHQSFYPNKPKDAYAHASWLMYNSKNVFAMWNHEYVGKNYDAEVGFVPRNTLFDPTTNQFRDITYWRLEPEIQYRYFPKTPNIVRYVFGAYLDHYSNQNLVNTDYDFNPYITADFTNSASFSIGYSEVFTKLLFPTDVSFTNEEPLPTGNYHYRNLKIFYNTDERKDLVVSGNSNYGTYFTGNRFSFTSTARYRKQPFGVFSLSYNKEIVALPELQDLIDLDLFIVEADITFTTQIYWTTVVQWNAQQNEFTYNTRFQWRYSPMSDVFIVFGENYNLPIHLRNRGLVLKWVHWFTL